MPGINFAHVEHCIPELGLPSSSGTTTPASTSTNPATSNNPPCNLPSDYTYNNIGRNGYKFVGNNANEASAVCSQEGAKTFGTPSDDGLGKNYFCLLYCP